MNELKVVAVRLVEEQPWLSGRKLTTPQQVAEFVGEKLAEYDRELFCILNLSTKGQVINMNIVSMGTLNASLVHPREVFKSAVLANANTMILIHNHPSGICEPSKEDLQMTERLRACGELLGIEVIDHVIAGGEGRYFSFKEKGLLSRGMKSPKQVADRECFR